MPPRPASLAHRLIPRVLVASALALVVGLVLLWRELSAPRPVEPAAARHPREELRSTTRARPDDATVRAASTSAVDPPGGVRTWSPTAAPTDGPDPFAPGPQVRTAEDTRAGLAD